ncbi:MAG: hypothetical protein E7104_12115 [Prevotella sp.]|nr:hypothetical protein [Prevotella sp.]
MTAGWTGRQERNAGWEGVRKNATAWTFKRTLERDGCWSVRNGWNECGGRCRHNMTAGWTGRLREMQDGGSEEKRYSMDI